MDLKEIRVDVNTRNRINSAQDRDYLRALVNTAPNLRIPYAVELVSLTSVKSYDCLASLTTLIIA
jgi:hypothetical protein